MVVRGSRSMVQCVIGTECHVPWCVPERPPLASGIGKYPTTAKITDVMDLSWFCASDRSPHKHCLKTHKPYIHKCWRAFRLIQRAPVKLRNKEF
jgi:hypothetical protein